MTFLNTRAHQEDFCDLIHFAKSLLKSNRMTNVMFSKNFTLFWMKTCFAKQRKYEIIKNWEPKNYVYLYKYSCHYYKTPYTHVTQIECITVRIIYRLIIALHDAGWLHMLFYFQFVGGLLRMQINKKITGNYELKHLSSFKVQIFRIWKKCAKSVVYV